MGQLSCFVEVGHLSCFSEVGQLSCFVGGGVSSAVLQKWVTSAVLSGGSVQLFVQYRWVISLFVVVGQLDV